MAEQGEASDVWEEAAEAAEYKQNRMLGKGAYGVVYVVTHLPTNKQYAMKKMEMRIGDEGVPQSVLREISTLTLLGKKGHPNILILHDTFHNLAQNPTGDILRMFLIMEKCDWDLYTFLKDIPRHMPERQCKIIIKQILSGVDFLHSSNVIHRDLKPQNILINQDQTIKIADFGLSRNYSSSCCFTTTVVTLWYRSPELLLQTSYNSAVDIWAVGCIIPEIFSRYPLLPAHSEAAQLQLILQKLGSPSPEDWPEDAVVDASSFPECTALPSDSLFPRLPPEGVEVVLKCLHFNPSLRASAKDVLLSPFLAGVPDFYQPSQSQPPPPLRQHNR